MHTYRNRLPQLSGDVFLTDGGLETTLIFHDGLVSCLRTPSAALRPTRTASNDLAILVVKTAQN